MKKQYEKPALYAEEFALTEHIAQCAGMPQQSNIYTHNDGTSCAILLSGHAPLFLTPGICVEFMDEGDTISCYEQYNPQMSAFGS